ncbi:MAG: hypothetical protein PHC52_13435 [Syntrophales bacterium]|nr:hypothetical protein [Syntrophales bacterium]
MIYFALAEKLGMTVAELLRRISSREITEWIAYYKIKSMQEQISARGGDISAELRRQYRG